MTEIKLNMENLNEQEREQLMKLVEKANEPKSKAWKPSKGEMYYYLFDSYVAEMHWDNRTSDEDRYAIGNCFKTREEAEFEAERLKVLTQWKRLSIESGEEDNPWDGKDLHWYVYYSTLDGCFYYSNQNHLRYGVVYFPTHNSIKNAVETIGAENVKKYILGIKEEKA